MKTIKRDVVTALIYSKNKKLLMAFKDENSQGVYKNCWHIIGGGIEEGESQLDAVSREIKEELGLDISEAIVQLVDDKGRGKAVRTNKETNEQEIVSMKFFVYEVRFDKMPKEIPIILSDELVKYDWFDHSDLKNVKLTPPSRRYFKRLGYLD